jgi:anti-anti-sigma regulatory factor
MTRAKLKPRREMVAAERKPRKNAGKSAKRTTEKATTAVSAQSSDEPKAEISAPVVLPETLDSSCAAGVREQLLTRRGSPLVVDAGQVRRTGMQAMQVLMAAARTWQADGQSYVLTNPTSEFLDTLALAGLSREHLLVEGISG